MINTIGNGCIFLALAFSLFGIALCFFGSKWGRGRWVQTARVLAYLNFFVMTVASLAMVYGLLTNDFSVSYVAHVGARETPRFYSAISLWSSLEGSILLWGWVLSGYTALCLYRYQNDFKNLMGWVSITLFGIGAFFYLVLAIPANPFQTVFPVPENGPGPNPLLQNHWLMALHPPLLYLGYVGMGVPFSFAIASLVTGELKQEWSRITKYWTLIAWAFLSLAIIFGGWWSYAVLGWGGYWAWDPVENASFMPWLTGTAFLHSTMVEERRQMLKVWNLGLIVTTFLLTLLGTFLTRSGILDSVHSFTESEMGHYFLIGIAITLAFSIALLIWKAPKLRSEGKLDHPICRETALLFANLLFVCFCFVVLLGTLYPLIVEALQGAKISVGEPFFNQMIVPIALLIILLMGVGVAIPWKGADWKTWIKLFRAPILAAIVMTVVTFAMKIREPLVLTTITFATLSLSVMVFEMGSVLKTYGRVFSVNPRRYGAFVVHIGAILIATAIALSGSYQQEQQVSLKEGEVFQFGGFEIKLNRIYAKEKPYRFEAIAETGIFKDGKFLGLLNPKLNFYPAQREPVGSPAIRSTLMGDLYLTFMGFDHKEGVATIRAMTTPAVSWIWGGGGVIVLGVLISVGMKKTRVQGLL